MLLVDRIKADERGVQLGVDSGDRTENEDIMGLF